MELVSVDTGLPAQAVVVSVQVHLALFVDDGVLPAVEPSQAHSLLDLLVGEEGGLVTEKVVGNLK